MKHRETIDLGDAPELAAHAVQVQASGTPLVLRREQEDVAVLSPVRRRRRRSQPVTQDDPLFDLIGVGRSGVAGGVSAQKHEQLARAYRPQPLLVLFRGTSRERRTFVDSSAYLALLDADDAYHLEAQAILGRLVEARHRQFTTNVLLIEAHALILSTLGRDHAARFLVAMHHSATVIVRVRATDEARATELLLHHADKSYSFADAISFVVMERLGIRSAFTFDQHFAQYGFLRCSPQTV